MMSDVKEQGPKRVMSS